MTVQGNPHPRRFAGVTLVELSLALGVTATIGLALAAMFFATLHSTRANRNTRTLLVARALIDERFGAAVRAARMVLDAGPDCVILWGDDAQANEAPDLSEIQRIEHDSSTNTLCSYRAPDNLPPADDVSYTLGTDFVAATEALKGSPSFAQARWARDVTSVTISLDDPDPRLATVVTYEIRCQMGDVADTFIGQIHVRER